MGPTEGRDVRQKVRRTVQAFAAAAGDGLAEMLGVPVDDDRGKKVQPGHAEVRCAWKVRISSGQVRRRKARITSISAPLKMSPKAGMPEAYRTPISSIKACPPRLV